jgi:hypothetical protein
MDFRLLMNSNQHIWLLDILLLLSHFPYAFLRRRIFFFLLMDLLDIW